MLLYLKEEDEQVNDKIGNFSSFPIKIQEMLPKFHNVFNSRLVKSMNVEPAQLNMVKDSRPFTCFTCRPNLFIYQARETL